MSIQHLEKPLKSYRKLSYRKPSLKNLQEYQMSTEKTPERLEKKKKKLKSSIHINPFWNWVNYIMIRRFTLKSFQAQFLLWVFDKNWSTCN